MNPPKTKADLLRLLRGIRSASQLAKVSGMGGLAKEKREEVMHLAELLAQSDIEAYVDRHPDTLIAAEAWTPSSRDEASEAVRKGASAVAQLKEITREKRRAAELALASKSDDADQLTRDYIHCHGKLEQAEKRLHLRKTQAAKFSK